MTLTLAGCQTDLYTGLTEREANDMIATLRDSGIEAGRIRQENGAITLKVDRDRFAESVHILEKAGLPRQNFARMGDVFKPNGLVVSPTQERAQMDFALSEELSRTISEISGVVTARVHIVLPEVDPFRRNVVTPSASVLISYSPGIPIAPLIPRIKTLVASGISGLDYSQVSVVAVPVAAPAPREATLPLVDVLGFSMTRTSAARAYRLAAGAALVLLVLGGGFYWTMRRKRMRRSYALSATR